MSKKLLNTEGIANDLRGASVFFQSPAPLVRPKPPEAATVLIEKPKPQVRPPASGDTVIPRHHDTTIPSVQDATIERIRAAVKRFGKEAATHRFTLEEKHAVAEVVFAFLGKGIRTRENEIARIGVNFLIADYRLNGEKSILYRVLEALNR